MKIDKNPRETLYGALTDLSIKTMHAGIQRRGFIYQVKEGLENKKYHYIMCWDNFLSFITDAPYKLVSHAVKEIGPTLSDERDLDRGVDSLKRKLGRHTVITFATLQEQGITDYDNDPFEEWLIELD